MGSVGEGGGGLATMREMRVREREVSWEHVCERGRRTDKRKEKKIVAGLIQGK